MSNSRVRQTLVRTTLVIGLSAGLAATLQGCVLAVAGAAAGGGALVATDRRTLGAQTEDREIQVKALTQMNNGLPDGSHVNVTVFNRRVLLTGEVPSDAAKQRAEEIVRAINNVNAIVNELAVGPASSLSDRANDSYLEGRVKTAMIAEKGISANNYKVVCERGNVYLMGLVTTDEGSRGADVASRVPGVEKVVKVFQYIKPQDAQALTAATPASGASAAAAPATAPEGATVGRCRIRASPRHRYRRRRRFPIRRTCIRAIRRRGRRDDCEGRETDDERSGRRDGGVELRDGGRAGGACGCRRWAEGRAQQRVHGVPRGGPEARRPIVPADRRAVQERQAGGAEAREEGEGWRLRRVGRDPDARAPADERCRRALGRSVGVGRRAVEIADRRKSIAKRG